MNQTFLATPDSRPLTGRVAARAGDGQAAPDLPVSGAVRLVEGTEAMRWVGWSR